jgi:hypothetical protein
MTALVIGNAKYPSGEGLANPVNDAIDFGAKLKTYGFEVIVATDCIAKDMEIQLKYFSKLLDLHDVGLFFFAGHGMQIEGSNYLLALDTDMQGETFAKHTSLSLDKVVEVMANSKASTKIIVLDACRYNPWERRWSRGPGSRGLASVYAPKGTIIGFATSPGEVAYDGIGRNGTYTSALLQHIDTPDCTIETMFKRVRNTVAAASAGKQTSWEHTSLSGEFYFNLSLGKLVDEYDSTALADGLFSLDPAKKSHKIIEELKSHNWYRQNSAIGLLTAESTLQMPKNNLFVIGRNIYQAACGDSNTAVSFINGFMSVTGGYDKEKRKAVLDGILFEVFFDSKGELRKEIKKGMFNEVFDLQRYSDFKSSFEFLAEVLTATNANFYAVPGKGHELAVSVSTKKKEDVFVVDAIYVGGANVLRPGEDSWDTDDGQPYYVTTSVAKLNQELTEQLIVPFRLLKITYTMTEVETSGQIKIQMGWTVRKGGAA